MKIKRIEHIAVAVKHLASMRDILENKLGLTLEYEENLPQYNTRIAMHPVGETYLEILESDKAGTEVSRCIDKPARASFTPVWKLTRSLVTRPNSRSVLANG